ncbi:MAG: 2-phospho-L-lactate guanylyltransferase [Alphaproteobacteria bacterium]|nr:2-phospho-L-lactate guanylyltransferase [Alphaproteobacteria bacterium]
MSGWVAIVPLKPKGQRKTRLGTHLAADQRDRLADLLADHVTQVLSIVPRIGIVAILSSEQPSAPHDRWIADHGRGLNEELAEARQKMKPASSLVVHGDLPGLCAADVDAMLDGAERQGSAIAPDRHFTGTNALALADDRPFEYAFGTGSFERHRASLGSECGIVCRPGLGLDLDTTADLDFMLNILRSDAGSAAVWTREASAKYVRAFALPETP